MAAHKRLRAHHTTPLQHGCSQQRLTGATTFGCIYQPGTHCTHARCTETPHCTSTTLCPEGLGHTAHNVVRQPCHSHSGTMPRTLTPGGGTAVGSKEHPHLFDDPQTLPAQDRPARNLLPPIITSAPNPAQSPLLCTAQCASCHPCCGAPHARC